MTTEKLRTSICTIFLQWIPYVFCVKATETMDKLNTYLPKLPILFKNGDTYLQWKYQFLQQITMFLFSRIKLEVILENEGRREERKWKTETHFVLTQALLVNGPCFPGILILVAWERKKILKKKKEWLYKWIYFPHAAKTTIFLLLKGGVYPLSRYRPNKPGHQLSFFKKKS